MDLRVDSPMAMVNTQSRGGAIQAGQLITHIMHILRIGIGMLKALDIRILSSSDTKRKCLVCETDSLNIKQHKEATHAENAADRLRKILAYRYQHRAVVAGEEKGDGDVRKLLFRVWDPNTDHMIVTNIGIDKIGLYDFDGDAITEQEGLVIMQYTGLNDRNGKEIYEGDIVLNHNPQCWSGPDKLVVRWQGGLVDWASDGMEWLKEKPGFRFERIGAVGTTVYVPHKHLEVIGNIYENPDLLQHQEGVRE